MEKKRKAAAEIFVNQYVQQQQAPQEVLGDLVAEEEKISPEMGAKRRKTPMSAAPPSPPPPQSPLPASRGKTSEELQLEKEPIKVRETGFWRWKRVIVPPNVYVVHTRIGRKAPVTIGLGVSFRYNPYADAYLIVPSAMQTIGVVANCITKEKQGINVLAYVQWQIDDFSVAYRKLDFSDTYDPLGIVNAQLSEQAEAAIKDKISTMSVEEVLTDKAPIIEELTTRLKAVAEGRKQGAETADKGLGIKIITVQIREALVSSQRLWNDLQVPFRHQQQKIARESQLMMQSGIRKKELETRQADETREAETMVKIERIKQSKETEAAELKTSEGLARFRKEQETAREKIQLNEQTTTVEQESQQRLQQRTAEMEQERALSELRREQEKTVERVKLETEAEKQQTTLQIEGELHALAEEERLNETQAQTVQQQLNRAATLRKAQIEAKTLLQEREDALKAQIQEANLARQRKERLAQLELEEKANQLKLAIQEKEVEIVRLHQEIHNLVNEHALLRQLIDKLPELAAQMPEIHELKVLQTDKSHVGFDALAAFLAKTLAVAESLGIQWKTKENDPSESHQEDDTKGL